MNDENKATPSERQQIIELTELRQQLVEAHRRIAELETLEVEREWAEEALQESTELFRQIAANTQDVFWVINLANNQVIYISPAYEQTWGRTRESLCADPDSRFDAIHPQDRERVRAAFEKQIRTEQNYTEEYRIVWPDGSIRWVQDRGFQIKDEMGKVYRIGGIATDITKRKQAEKEQEHLLRQIQEQSQRMQQIINTVPEGVLLLDAGRKVVLANPVAEENLAALAEVGIGDTLVRLGKRPLAELLISHPEGLWHEVTLDERVFEVVASPTKADNPAKVEHVEGWVLVVRDVTQEREIGRRIQLQERLAAVGQLAAGIAHDFNNILATIVLYAQITARSEEVSDRIRERMETINQQAYHATNLIRQILDFSRRSILERQPLDLVPLLKEQAKLLERTLPESIELMLEHNEDKHASSFVINADPTRIQQAITNLVVNARDAMPGGGSLRIGLDRTADLPPSILTTIAGKAPSAEREGEWVQITVSDTGTGIPPEVLPHIFEPFFTTKAPLGTGLGLAQVHGIVGQHDGYIGVDTSVGKGTTFTMYLPALPAHSLETSVTERPSIVEGQGEVILVVEDNADVREALVDSLRQLNYQTLEAADGHEALTIYAQHAEEIALVLSDVVMPGMGGITLLHTLKAQGLSVPIVMMTGHSLQKSKEELCAEGIAGWISKPPNLEQLAEVVGRALNR